ncbi:MAG: glycosyltransferase [Methanobrevibacter sp.]|nr:glycosyltransferase [Methanobrevibacter sp.]
MKNIKVSVIIPVHNSEKYLEECLNSVINQTLKDIEIICINDNSNDNSLAILEKYAEEDDRITIINNEENIGGGLSRNKGLKVAKGEYIYFIDSDDWVEKNTLEYTYNEAKKKNLDLVFFLAMNYDNETKEFYEIGYYNYSRLDESFFNRVFHPSEVKKIIFHMPVSPPLKLYKKELLDNINAKFPKERVMHDNPFFYNVFLNAQRVEVINKYFYYRRRHGDSLMNMRGVCFSHIIPISNLIVDVFKKNKVFFEYKKPVLNRKVYIIRIDYNRMDEKYQKQFYKEIVKEFNKISENSKENEDYISNLNERNLTFYLNILKSKSYSDFSIIHKISILEMDKNELKRKVKSLKKENKELKNKIKIMETSNSWKITKPIRIFTNLFKKR